MFFGRLDAAECTWKVVVALDTCNKMGVPVAWDKLKGPSTRLHFLGLKLDSVRRIINLSAEKLTRTQAQDRHWLSRRSCTKRELLALIGILQQAAAVVKPESTFIRRIIDVILRKLCNIVSVSIRNVGRSVLVGHNYE